MSYVTPQKNAGYIFYTGLSSQADSRVIKVNPTLAYGDAKVSIDGGALNNLGTTPTVTPAGGTLVKVTLSAAEMNGDNITVVLSDAAGGEWCDLVYNIQTTVNQVDSLALAATALTNATWTDARASKLDILSTLSGNVTVTTPIGVGQDLTLINGNDYLAADARSLIFTSAGWPSLIGAAISFQTRYRITTSPPQVIVAGTVLSASSIQIELTATQTASMLSGKGAYTIVATLSNGHVVTLISGAINMIIYP